MEIKNSFVILPLAVLLFVSGYLFNKVSYLEKTVLGTNTALGNQAPAAAAPQQPEEPSYNLDKVREVDSGEHIRGSKNADIVLVEYSDYECPFCKRFHESVKQAMDEYGDKIAWVYRHYPLPFHQNAQMEAEASECVAELGGNDAFWKFTDQVYATTDATGTSYTKDRLVGLVKELGLDTNKFTSCLDSGKYTNKVQADLSNGSEVGINGTPGTVVIAKNGQKTVIPGALPYEQVKSIIDGLN